MKKLSPVLLIIAIAVFTGCSQVTQGLSYAMDLQEVIADKYDSDEVQVKIDNDLLIVSLIDDKFSGYSDAEKQEMVEEISGIAKSLDNKPELLGGEVKFVIKGLDGLVKTSTSDSREMEW